MTKSQHAIRAAQNYHIWGRDATMRYAQHHGVVSLYRLARQLHALAK